MKVKEKYIIELERNEAEVLKTFLGDMPDNIKVDLGMTSDEIETFRELYNSLPDRGE